MLLKHFCWNLVLARFLAVFSGAGVLRGEVPPPPSSETKHQQPANWDRDKPFRLTHSPRTTQTHLHSKHAHTLTYISIDITLALMAHILLSWLPAATEILSTLLIDDNNAKAAERFYIFNQPQLECMQRNANWKQVGCVGIREGMRGKKTTARRKPPLFFYHIDSSVTLIWTLVLSSFCKFIGQIGSWVNTQINLIRKLNEIAHSCLGYYTI